MRIHPEVSTAINEQVGHELDAAYAYLGMAAYFDSKDLKGFAGWFRRHAQEEIGHAMRLYELLVSCGVAVQLKGMESPQTEFESPRAAIEAALHKEEQVTHQIKNIFETTNRVKEYSVHPTLHWFLDEQVKEEDLFSTVLKEVTAAQSNDFHLLQLDRQMAVAQSESSSQG